MWVTDQNHISFEQNSKGWKEKRAIVTRFFSPKLLDEHHFRVQEAEYDYKNLAVHLYFILMVR